MTRVTYVSYNIERKVPIVSSKKVIKLLRREGWYLDSIVGSHHHFKHPSKLGKVTVPHPKKSLKLGTLNNILKQAGLK